MNFREAQAYMIAMKDSENAGNRSFLTKGLPISESYATYHLLKSYFTAPKK